MLLALSGSARADDEPGKMARYFAELVRVRVLDPQTGSPQALTGEVARAEKALDEGDLVTAVSVLYGVVDNPRFTDFDDTPQYQNAEYDLIVALAGAGAHDAALATVERVLARGPQALYWDVAHRRAVDIALETRRYGPVLARVEAIKLAGELPTSARDERAYLRGRAAYEAGDLATAEKELASVGRKSRLFTSATYLRGVLRARQGMFDQATLVFCEIAQTADADRFTFFIDDRYYALKDLARLGMGRIAHEEKRFDDAYYHYFQIPDDSERLAEALFESAWSMYQKRELRTARLLVEELEKTFPTSPLLPEAGLLAGYIELADCRFEAARKRFDQVIGDTLPLIAVVVSAQAAGSVRRALLTRALERQPRQWKRGAQIDPAPLTRTPEDRVLALLRVDPRLVRLNDAAAALSSEAATAGYTARAWRDLSVRLARVSTAQTGSVETVADQEARRTAELLGEVRRLRAEVRRERQLLVDGIERKRVAREVGEVRLPELEAAERALAELEERAEVAARDADDKVAATGDGRVRAFAAAELGAAEKLGARGRELLADFERTSEAAASAELARLRKELERVVERAKLGKVDAVIGEKRKAEKDIEDLAAGTYVPPELGKAFQQGLIDEDEIYWPPEEEVWEDEYDRWK